MNDLKDKYQGSILGLAIGDALGAPVEFQMPGEFELVSDFRDAAWFNLPAGHWTDDTAMALCLANSLIEKGFDPVDQMEKYLKWYMEGYCSSTGKAVGIGQTIMRALVSYTPGESPYVAISGRLSDGNGSLMRIAPIALYFRKNPIDAMKYAELSSKITHGSTLCAEACQYYTGLIIGALNGAAKEEILSHSFSPIENYWQEHQMTDEIQNIAAGSYKEIEPPDIQGRGYVVKSMEAALWAFYSSESYEEGVLKVVNLGDDADTTGAIYGQLAGAYYGMKQIPVRWVDNIAKKDELMRVAVGLQNQ